MPLAQASGRSFGALVGRGVRRRRVTGLTAFLTAFAISLAIVGVAPRSTEAITFEPAQNLSESPGPSDFSDTFASSRATQLAASGANVYVVWQDGMTTPNSIVFRRSTDRGATWEPPQTLANGVRPTVVADGILVFVTWQDQNTGCCSFRRSIDGGQTFEAAQNFGFITASSNNFYRLTIVGSRVYLLVLQTPNFATQNVGFRRSTDGGATWDPPLDEPPGVLSSRPPMQTAGLALAVAGQRVYAAWPSELDGSRVVFFRRSMDGGATFEPEEILVSGSVNPVELAAVGDQVYFAAARFVGVICDLTRSEPIRLVCFNSKEIVFRSSNDGGATWVPSLVEEPVNISRTSGSSDLPFVAAGPNNTVYLFWAESPTDVNFDPFDVMFRRSTDGGITWNPSLEQPATSLGAQMPDNQPAHIVVKGTAIAAAWQDGVPGSVHVLFRHSPDGGQSWDPALDVSALDVSEDIGGRPQVALGDAHAYVAWVEAFVPPTGHSDIFFRRGPGFDFALDWLRVDGNILGSGNPDGVTDFFDNFDDGSLTAFPTSEFFCNQPVEESGGFLRFRSADGFNTLTPGVLQDSCSLGAATGNTLLDDGAGDAVITASFRADVPEIGQGYGMVLVTFNGTTEAVNIQVEILVVNTPFFLSDSRIRCATS